MEDYCSVGWMKYLIPTGLLSSTWTWDLTRSCCCVVFIYWRLCVFSFCSSTSLHQNNFLSIIYEVVSDVNNRKIQLWSYDDWLLAASYDVYYWGSSSSLWFPYQTYTLLNNTFNLYLLPFNSLKNWSSKYINNISIAGFEGDQWLGHS